MRLRIFAAGLGTALVAGLLGTSAHAAPTGAMSGTAPSVGDRAAMVETVNSRHHGWHHRHHNRYRYYNSPGYAGYRWYGPRYYGYGNYRERHNYYPYGQSYRSRVFGKNRGR